MADPSGAVLAPTLYYDRHFSLQAAKILPGEYFVTSRDMVLVTVLGSCVSACIRDKQSGIGGMNHFMLPEITPDPSNPFCQSARYANHAMEVLINHLIRLGAQRPNLRAKVFGGGSTLRGMPESSIGKRNADFILQYLERENIQLSACDLLDDHPRKVYFFPNTGQVFIRRLRKQSNSTIIHRENKYVSVLENAKIEGDVELFI